MSDITPDDQKAEKIPQPAVQTPAHDTTPPTQDPAVQTPAHDTTPPTHSNEEVTQPSTPTSDIYDQESEEVEDDDVFDGEQDETTRLNIEKDLITESDNEPTLEDGTQPEEVDG